MRQRINQIVLRASRGDIRGCWELLYKEFSLRYHINFVRRADYNTFNGNKMDYIDQKLRMIPELYDVCCKLYFQAADDLKEEFSAYNVFVPSKKQHALCKKYHRNS